MSLERRLPLLISGLLLVVVAVFVYAAWRESRTSALLLARERLRTGARQLAGASQNASGARTAAMRRVVSAPEVHAVLRAGATAAEVEAARRVVADAYGRDSLVDAWVLLAPDATPRANGGTTDDTPAARTHLAQAIDDMAPDDTAGASPFFVLDGRVHNWTVTPVADGGRRIGWFALRRHIGDSPMLEEQLSGLAGGNVSIYLASVGGVWSTLRGAPQEALVPLGAPVDTFTVNGPAGRILGAVATVPSSRFAIVLTTPERVVLARPARFLRRMIAVGAVLLLVGALGAWRLGRHVVRPLQALREAADSVSLGHFDQRVAVARRDEIGQLGTAFNAMATRLGESHAELEQQYEESVAMSQQLEDLNDELRLAQAETLRAVSRTDRLQSVSAALVNAVDISDVATAIMHHGLGAVGAYAGSVFLLSRDGQSLELVRSEGYSQAVLLGRATIAIEAEFPISEAARRVEPIYVESLDEWRGRYGHIVPQPSTQTQAWAALPLVARDRVIGAMGLSFREPGPFDEETRAFLRALAQQCAGALDRALLFDATQQAREDAEAARESAQTASQAKSAFLAMMSHELRTPLNAIGGYVDLLELGLRGPVSEAQREDLARIRRNQHHLLAIITDILSLSRIEAGQIALDLTDVPVSEVLRDVEALIAPQLAAKGLQYEAAAADGAVVRADREKLQQVLLNLLSNAVRFTDAGVVEVTSEVTATTVALRVRDTGIGIPPEKLDVIFEPFVQVDSGLTRRTGGTGLGLAISREFATAMEGRILVESEVGRGSVFTLELPRVVLAEKESVLGNR